MTLQPVAGRAAARIAARAERASERDMERAVAPHLMRLRAVAERILGCPEQAHDAVQEVLVTLWRTAEMPVNLRAWLTRTVIHRALHARRSSERRRKYEDLAGAEAIGTCALCDPERALESRELLRALDAALRALSAEHLRILELRAVEGLEYEDIADRLGVPVGTVRSRLNRARLALRGEMERWA